MAELETHKAVDEVSEKINDLKVDEQPSSEPTITSTETVQSEKNESENDDSVTNTVFKSIENFSVVHPLTHQWTLWYTKPQTGNEEWHNLLKKVVTVSTVEEFWGAYNSVPKVSELPMKADYSFFSEGVRPEWEDPRNSKGGKWMFQYRSGRRSISVDEAWLKVLLGMIGGTLDNEDVNSEQINGAFISIRKAGIKINLWTKHTNQELVRPIGLRFKALLGLAEREEIEFTAHEAVKGRSKVTL
ncbi:translation initiation factor eIF4E [Sugiyamaella lignohabitans]|uniref:Translation initiation factor eIF4E n=1 Tax=Sugiyamaella lignohabitans TaxID=796027 RepID=A0A167DY98_9ASCO|nr:translation initiation factor eIF4E [Sugiyamaella lignohabitans]ANB13436.1 translation initiation factor eIF4E [Sugiyamaella lignohabitans]